MQLSKIFFILFVTSVVFSSCRRDNRGELLGINSENFSIEQENVIGKQISDAIAESPIIFPIVNEAGYPGAYSYLRDSVMKALLRPLKRRKNLVEKVFIIDNDEREHAFFLPNGDFYIDIGLLKFLKNDSELAGVILHEIAYLEGNFILENLKNNFGASLLNELAAQKKPEELDDIVLHFSTIDYDRSQITYADSSAIISICPFNYDPKGLRNVIERASDLPIDFWIDWLNLKQVPVTTRKELIDEILSIDNCTLGGVTNRAIEYEHFINQLLP